MTCDTNAVNVQQNFVSPNLYAPLLYLPENHNSHEAVLKLGTVGDCDLLKNMKTTSPQHKMGRKITTIVNGQVLNNDNEKTEGTSGLTIIQLHTHGLRPTKFTHKVEVLGDSHLIGSAAVINQILDEKYKVCSLTQPGACTKQIVDSQEVVLKSLGKSDVIVINGGSNDIEEANCRVNGILNLMVHFIQKYANTNIVIVNIPYRDDLWKYDKKNLCIQDYNNKLKHITNIFQHVSLVETSSDWRLYTRYGFHLNRSGKGWLAKQIACQIESLVKLSSKARPVINLKWKEESTNLNNGNVGLTTEINRMEDLVPSTQSLFNLCYGENKDLVSRTLTTNIEEATYLNKGTSKTTTGKDLGLGPSSLVQSPKNQCNGDNNEETRRISTRNKKASITMSNDFLW
jgi:Lysophospholipase L1 and related esterases